MKRINCIVSDEAKIVLIRFKNNNKYTTQDEALSALLEDYYTVE